MHSQLKITTNTAGTTRFRSSLNSWLCYDEVAVVKDSKCYGQAILRYAYVAATLRELQPNLAFNKTDVARVMEKICIEFYQYWGLSLDQFKDWSETMTRRLRNFLHHISAAEANNTKPEWVLRLSWLAAPFSRSSAARGAGPIQRTTSLVGTPSCAWHSGSSTTTRRSTTTSEMHLLNLLKHKGLSL